MDHSLSSLGRFAPLFAGEGHLRELWDDHEKPTAHEGYQTHALWPPILPTMQLSHMIQQHKFDAARLHLQHAMAEIQNDVFNGTAPSGTVLNENNRNPALPPCLGSFDPCFRSVSAGTAAVAAEYMHAAGPIGTMPTYLAAGLETIHQQRGYDHLPVRAPSGPSGPSGPYWLPPPHNEALWQRDTCPRPTTPIAIFDLPRPPSPSIPDFSLDTATVANEPGPLSVPPHPLYQQSPRQPFGRSTRVHASTVRIQHERQRETQQNHYGVPRTQQKTFAPKRFSNALGERLAASALAAACRTSECEVVQPRHDRDVALASTAAAVRSLALALSKPTKKRRRHDEAVIDHPPLDVTSPTERHEPTEVVWGARQLVRLRLRGADVQAVSAPSEEDSRCPICLSDLKADAYLETRDEEWGNTKCCGVGYHSSCLSTWLNNHAAEVQCPGDDGSTYKTQLEGKCPTCHQPISKSKRRMFAAVSKQASSCQSSPAGL